MIEKVENCKEVLNLKILNITEQYLLEHLQEGVLFTPNLDHLVRLQKDKEFYRCYQNAEWIVCDSRVLYAVSHFTREPFVEAIPGSSFFTSYYMYHRDDKDCRIFLLGAKEGVAKRAMEKINCKIGRDIVVGAHSPTFGFERNEQECLEIVDMINRSGANVLLVGVGAPKQEKWITAYRNRLKGIKLFMALGATIDFEAGEYKRAPKLFQLLCLEWLYRAFREPRRLLRRYFVDDVRFFYYFAKQQLNLYVNPFK